MKLWADSSFIVPLYLPEPNSARAIAIINKHRQPLPFTPWHRLEVRNAIRLAAARKVISVAECDRQLKQIETDLREQILIVHKSIDWTDVLRRAEDLGAAFNIRIGCRSADLFHVAAAKELDCDSFASFDQNQRKMASAAGLRVV